MTGFDSKRQAAQAKLAQPEQEPVAWMYTSRLAGNQQYITRFQHDLTTYKADKVWPLYTTPPAAQRPWVGLTDEEIQAIWDVAAGAIPGWSRHIAYARAIEAAHNIKEGT